MPIQLINKAPANVNQFLYHGMPASLDQISGLRVLTRYRNTMYKIQKVKNDKSWAARPARNTCAASQKLGSSGEIVVVWLAYMGTYESGRGIVG